MTHTELSQFGYEQIEFLANAGVSPEHIIVSHMDRVIDVDSNSRLAGMGVFLEYDTIARYKYHSDEDEVALIGEMVKQGFGHIVNTASMAAFMATAAAAPYGATKHAVYGLSRALRAEGVDHGVRVSVLCPGVIRTPILEDGGRYGRLAMKLDPETMRALWERLRPMHPDLFAAKALDAVARNRGLIIIPAWWRLLRVIGALFPSLGVALAVRDLRRVRPLLKRASPDEPQSG